MEPHREIAINAPLFNAIKDIWEHGYVLVRDVDQTISGIVTASDFARQFAQLAQPFLIIGEIELHLRNLVSKFTLEEMAEASGDPSTSIEGSWDLNFGTYCRLLENPDRWDRLGLRVDRATFMHNLGQVREMRNEVMHFAPDGLDPNEVEKLGTRCDVPPHVDLKSRRPCPVKPVPAGDFPTAKALSPISPTTPENNRTAENGERLPSSSRRRHRRKGRRADGCESCECGVRKDRQTNGSGILVMFEDAFSLARDWPGNSKPRGHPAIWQMTIE